MSFLSKILNCDEPQFNIGDTVYIPSRQGANETFIRSINVEVIPHEDKLYGIIRLYNTGYLNLDTWSTSWPADMIYKTKDEAEAASKWWPVALKDEEWQELTGMSKDRVRIYEAEDEDDLSIENCILSICCATISNIRDWMHQAWTNGGLMEWERLVLQDLIIKHEPPLEHEILTKFLTQLNLTWNQ